MSFDIQRCVSLPRLGDTLEIIKRDCPVLIRPSVPLEIVQEIAMEKRADEVCRSQDVFGADSTVFHVFF
jgi:hypothetical protein